MQNYKQQSGIYKIENNINHNIYIGSAVDIGGRWTLHINELKRGCHCNIHLQRAFHKYGYKNFSFTVVEFCEKAVLIEREQFYIDTLKPEYNICKKAGSRFGIKASAITIQRLRDSHKGKPSNFKGKKQPKERVNQ